jgi:hypothetical protein
VRLHIHGHDLPAWAPSSGDLPGTPSVGVQRKQQAALLQDRGNATGHWVIEADLVETPDGSVDLRGPWVHGRAGDRFVYLTWGFASDDEFTMVRRAKLMLAAVDAEQLHAAQESDQPLIGSLSLTGNDGTPVCAAVRPPAISWTVGPCPETG